MKKVRVSLKERSYDIAFGQLNSSFTSALKKAGLRPGPLALVTTAAVKKAGHAARVTRLLKSAGFRPTVIAIPNGEKHKTLETLNGLYRAAVKSGLDRRSSVVALGGGVVTDLAGFLAATYMRGVPLVSVPTTLLAMVDAAIGGKTGVDLPEGKNLVGAFWQPKLVWIDPSVLSTLPRREWNTGFAEIVKYGVIKDRAFFDWLEKSVRANARVETWRTSDLMRAIHTSVAIKAAVVSADERETPLGGGREILNFGHTVGHALEAATAYNALSHGEAISVGMIAAGLLAIERKQWSTDEQLRLLLLLESLSLPTRVPARLRVRKDAFWSALRSDKKNIGGTLRFVLPKKMGRVEVRSGIAASSVATVLKKIGW
jgi:3-dehydroquinate synthase